MSSYQVKPVDVLGSFVGRGVVVKHKGQVRLGNPRDVDLELDDEPI